MPRLRAAQWFAGSLGVLLLVFAALVIFVTLIVDPNRFRGRIERLVTEVSGQPFRIQGSIDISWYPWLALKMGAAQLGEAPALIEWRSASFGARLIPLIKGQLVISRVRLDGLRASLQRTADGRSNWESLLKAQQGSPSNASPQIGGLEIHDGALTFVDAKRGTWVALSDWRFELGAFRSGESFSLSTQFNLQPAAAQPAVRVSIDVPAIELNTEPLAASISTFKMQVGNAFLSGRAVLDRTEPIRARGELALRTQSLRELLAALAVGGPRPLDSKALGAWQLDTPWALDAGAFVAKPIRMQLDDTAFAGEVTRTAGANPIVYFQLHGDHIELDRYVRLEDSGSEPFELPTEALKALRVAGALTFTQAQVGGAQVRNARIRLETP